MRDNIYIIRIPGMHVLMKYLPLFLLMFFSGNAFAQQAVKNSKICSNLQKIITSAQKTNLGDMRGNALGGNKYASATKIFGGNSSVYYDETLQSNVYEEIIPSENLYNDSTGQQETALNEILKCLDKNKWTLQAETDSFNNKAYNLKNLQTRVFMLLDYQAENIRLRVYTQVKTIAKCISGDCENGFGTMQYESGDLYEGQFFNSRRIGVGKYIWAADQTRYEGSWLEDTINGFGTYYNAQGEPEKTSYFMRGNILNLDTAKKNFCQYGDCLNGFGLYYYKTGELYIGHFKNALQNGLGLYESKDGVYYGEFANGKFNGRGIIFTTDDVVFRSTFVNGIQQGNTEIKQGGNVIQGNLDDSVLTGAEYSDEGILKRVGAWQDGTFLPSDKKNDKYIEKFAESLAKIYEYRVSKYGRLKGNAHRGRRGVFTYDAIIELEDASNTYIREEPKDTFVRANMNRTPLPKEDAIKKYEWAVRTLRKSLNQNWKSDPGDTKDTETAVNRNYIFVNMKDKKSYIEVIAADNMIYIDIH